MSIPQSFLTELLSRVDVVDVVGRYVPLKKGGANYMGLCPFHGEKSPSFSVSPTKQFYHCFGCGKNGNAIGFLMDYAGLGFVEAVHELAQQAGLQVPQEDVSPAERERAARQREREQTICGVLERAGEAWRRQLKASPRAIDYLKGRGLSGEIARRFGLGYAPEGWRGLASVFPDYADPLLIDSGLVIEAAEGDGGEVRRYDRFRDRIMFPIRNVKGECIGFGGRVLGDEKPKYLNSPETPVFSKGRELYGLFEAREAIRQAGHVLVTEGYMDVVALAQLGFAHAVATLGTACTPEHLHKLFRFTDHVVFSFDGDAAGRRAARKALEGALPHATDTRTVRFLFLPEEHDPDSFIRAHGAEAFAAQVAQAQPLSRFLLDCARGDADLGTAEGRAQMTAHARPLWQALPDGALKRQLRAEIAAQVQLPVEELAALWGDTATRPTTGRPAPGGASHGPGGGTSGSASFSAPRPPVRRWPAAGGRQQPSSRADHATRLLLLHHGLLHTLSGEEQALLTELPEPHGPLIAWLESQWHDHGALPWAALREALRDHPGEALALRLAEGPALADGEPAEAASELRGLLDLMLDDHLKQRESAALAAQDIPAYRALLERRQALARDRLRARREPGAAP